MAEETETKEEEEQEDKVEKAARLNDELGEKVARLEKLRAEEILSGKSAAGEMPAPKKEVSDEDYAKAALQGTLLE